MKSLVNQENKIPKQGRTVIKCDKCNCKYYEGDEHKCDPFMMIQSVKNESEKKIDEGGATEKENVDQKKVAKTYKESFKIKW